MKILHLRSSEFFGGPERAIIGQCLSMQKFPLACASFVRGNQTNNFLDKCRENGIETFAIKATFPGDIRIIKRIRNLILSNNFNIVVTHDYKVNFYAHFAVKGTNARQIAHFRGRTAEDAKVKIYNYIDEIILKKIPRIIVVSEPSKMQLVDKGINPEKIHVVFNAIKCLDENGPQNVEQELNGSLKVVAAGRLSFEKGYDVLLEAISIIKDKAPPFEVSIYGNGSEGNRLKIMSEELDLIDIVKFRGFVDDIRPIFASSDLMVLPSRSEGMPNVILEAWSQKLGVLSTSVGAVPDMFGDEENGILVEPENPEELADKLMYALGHPEKINQYGQKGYAVACERYSFDKQADLLMEIYQEYLEGGPDE